MATGKKDESPKTEPPKDKNNQKEGEGEQVWPQRADPQSRLPRVVLKWLVSLKLRNKFLHPRWDAASGVLIAEILSRYYPETGPGYILQGCYGHGWDHFERNWFFLKQFFKNAKLAFPRELITPLMTRKGNAGYFALVWLWETFEPKTKLPRIEKGVSEPSSKGGAKNPTIINDDVIKNLDFFHHDKAYQDTLPIGQRETHLTCFRQNVTGNQMKWDDCHQSWANWSNRLLEEQREEIELLKKDNPSRMGQRKCGILWKGIRKPFTDPKNSAAPSAGTVTSGRSKANGSKANNANRGSYLSLSRHANKHAALK